MALAVFALCGFAIALAAPFLPTWRWRAGRWLAAGPPAASFAYFLSLVPEVADGGTVIFSREWIPTLGIAFALRADGLSLLMALLVSGMGAVVVLYAGEYLRGKPGLGRFMAYLFGFMASMLGLVLANDLITLFVFWELTSITSFLLISFESEKPEARKAATQALLVTGGGGLALLAGFALIGIEAGTYDISRVTAGAGALTGSGWYLAILLLVLAGAFTKSAQFPFHFWLPGAMAAPTPVSAYLHSATMVKAGVYLLARLHPALGGTTEWTFALTTFGAVTMVVGGYVALHQRDLKLILAYSTVGALGLLVLLLGIGTGLAVKGAVVFLLAHALYKGTLFLAAGSIDHGTGTRDINALGGLSRAMPVTAAALAIGAVSLAGFGPVLAFIGKEALIEAALHFDRTGELAVLAAVVAGGALFAAAAGMVARVLIGTLQTPHTPHESPPEMLVGPVLLSILSVGLAVAPGIIGTDIVSPAAGAIAGEPVKVKLALWHGFNMALLLSVVSVGVAAAVVWSWPRIGPLSERGVNAAGPFRPGELYEWSLLNLNRVARQQTHLLQNGYLRLYLAVTLATAAALVAAAIAARGGVDLGNSYGDIAFYEGVIAAVIISGAGLAIRARDRLTAVAALGAVGFGVALVYAFFGAPDLALTQFLVETLTVLLFVLVFYRLPRLADVSAVSTRVRDAVLSIAAGALMSVLVLASITHRSDHSLTQYFAETSKPLAHGRNVVNVILVDFRALDTLGEIIVIAVAALGVVAMLKLKRGEAK
jgi:multicomponent Na+:H+ antiporter subunit A